MPRRFDRRRLRDIPCAEVPRSHYGGLPFYGAVESDWKGNRTATVRNDLSPRLKRHTRLHERVHIKYDGGEIQTNLISAAIDPIGFINMVFSTIRDKERRRYYLYKIKKRL
jgi:hypothetical protein